LGDKDEKLQVPVKSVQIKHSFSGSLSNQESNVEGGMTISVFWDICGGGGAKQVVKSVPFMTETFQQILLSPPLRIILVVLSSLKQLLFGIHMK